MLRLWRRNDRSRSGSWGLEFRGSGVQDEAMGVLGHGIWALRGVWV